MRGMDEMMRFTEKLRTKTMSFMTSEDELHTICAVIVETTDGRKMTVQDENSPTGILGGDNRNEAIRKGKAFLQSMADKQNSV